MKFSTRHYLKKNVLQAAVTLVVAALLLILIPQESLGGVVKIKNNQLFVDGHPQPQLFGAELQYFRLRGGQGRNIPREKVVELWSRALDRMVEAKMNAISFYIPWDFHEYAEGKFDFTGTVDEDGDGKADYPSRDLFTFFRLIEERGIRHIMARPGPYINAEWGFLGFGAIPLWFHEKYPDSHMKNPQGFSTKLYDYHNPDLLRHTQVWFETLHTQVLSKFIGVGKPVSFLQIDNETNFMWQSIYNHDYGPRAISRYQKFLQDKYSTLEQVNLAHSRSWGSWKEVKPPMQPKNNLAEDQDWYRFQDESIRSYLQIIRGFWEKLGVQEPDVLFTLAESYNAAGYGLLPNYDFRNQAGKTGMMTVNLYPKTYEWENTILNSPFKSDHDVKAADRASDAYIGNASEWVLGPEIQGGWWKGIEVTSESRRQTYLTTLGHGLKAIFIYYFNEGQNWQSDWATEQVRPVYQKLKATSKYSSYTDDQLPNEFWSELQSQMDRTVVAGLDVRFLMKLDLKEAAELYFDAPLDGDAQPRDHFYELKDLGEKVIAPYQDFLGQAVAVTDDVCLIKDVAQHVPSPLSLDHILFNSEWQPGLMGLLMQSGINPKIVHWGINPASDLNSCRLIVYQDSEIPQPSLLKALKQAMSRGATVLSFLGDQVSKELKLKVSKSRSEAPAPVFAKFQNHTFEVSSSPLFIYDLTKAADCKAVLQQSDKVLGYKCPVGRKSGSYWQVGALFYDVINSSRYGNLTDVPQRRALIDQVLQEVGVVPQIQIKGGGDRVVAFGRQDTKGESRWVTVKNARSAAVHFQVQVQNLKPNHQYLIRNLLSSSQETLTGKELARTGFSGSLKAFDSSVFWIEEL